MRAALVRQNPFTERAVARHTEKILRISTRPRATRWSVYLPSSIGETQVCRSHTGKSPQDEHHLQNIIFFYKSDGSKIVK